jgi:hypothetical protein
MTIRVRCSGPGHARDKVANIAVFGRDDAGVWTDRRVNRHPRAHHARADGHALFRCKLCRRELPVWATDRRVLFPVLDFLDSRGRVDVELSDLVELASAFIRSGLLAHP